MSLHKRGKGVLIEAALPWKGHMLRSPPPTSNVCFQRTISAEDCTKALLLENQNYFGGSWWIFAPLAHAYKMLYTAFVHQDVLSKELPKLRLITFHYELSNNRSLHIAPLASFPTTQKGGVPTGIHPPTVSPNFCKRCPPTGPS